MPLYEGKENVLNSIKVSPNVLSKIVNGTQDTIKYIVEVTEIAFKQNKSVAFDGWYGVDFIGIATKVKDELSARGIKIEMVNAATISIGREKIREYKKTFVTDDPSFGWVNDKGIIEVYFG